MPEPVACLCRLSPCDMGGWHQVIKAHIPLRGRFRRLLVHLEMFSTVKRVSCKQSCKPLSGNCVQPHVA